jgi:hypothetical protein
MTRSEIEQLLAVEMNSPPTDGKDLVYALVKIRKLLEHKEQKNDLWTLTFYCDWALHSELDRSGAKKFLKILDETLGRFNPATWEQVDPDAMVHKVISFDLFRDHLSTFLRRNDLPIVWTEDMFAWDKTRRLYGEEVKSTPLVVTRKDYKFKYLSRLVITACEADEKMVKANPDDKWWGLKWECTLSDGRTFPLGYSSSIGDPPPNWLTQGKM